MVRHLATVILAAASISLISAPIVSATIAKVNAGGDTDAASHRRLTDALDYDSKNSVDSLSRLLEMKSQTRKLDETKNDCGVLFYYHIPGTKGAALNEWLMKLEDANNAQYISSSDDGSFLEKVEKSLDNEGWTIIHAQDDSLSLHLDESKLEKWRETVTKKQCQFVVITNFADTIDYSVAHTYKKFAQCNCTPEVFKERNYDMDTPFDGQLDYLLFNNGEYDGTLETKDKVKRGIEILQKHFDLVLLNNREQFVDTVLKVTGWPSPGPLAEKAHGSLIFTKDLVSQYNKVAAKNGDGDFVDAVGHVYNSDLAYLVAALMDQ
ncbi:hypothetical protein ACHAXN_012121 [Cyclotella atomus]|jgi:hypothetical protein